jgi:hypothetical protein
MNSTEFETIYLIIRDFKTYLTTTKQFDLNDEVYEIKLKDINIYPEPNEYSVPLKLFKFEYVKTGYTFSFNSDLVDVSLLPTKYFDILRITNSRRSKTLSLESIKELDIKRKLVKELTNFNIKYPQYILLYNSNDINSINKAIELKNKFEEIIIEIENFNKIQ